MVKLEVVHFIGKGISRDSVEAGGHERSHSYRHRHRHKHRHKHMEAGSFLRTPFTEGCAGANKKASPPGRKKHCTFRATTFSSVQFS